MKNMKQFLKLRDTRDEFKIVRRVHAVGIPTLMLEKTVYVGPTNDQLDELFSNKVYIHLIFIFKNFVSILRRSVV